MRIHLYTISYNDAPRIPYFLRHYSQYVQKILVWDNGSTDNTVDLLKQSPLVEMHYWQGTSESICDDGATLRNLFWKNEKEADWILCCDVDELIVGDWKLLETSQAIIRPQGYDMISYNAPTTTGQIYEEIVEGVFNIKMCKPVLFRPKLIKDMCWTAGLHEAYPVGQVAWDDLGFKLLHYRYLGLNETLARNEMLRERLGRVDVIKCYGHKYWWDRERLEAHFAELWEKRQVVYP